MPVGTKSWFLRCLWGAGEGAYSRRSLFSLNFWGNLGWFYFIFLFLILQWWFLRFCLFHSFVLFIVLFCFALFHCIHNLFYLGRNHIPNSVSVWFIWILVCIFVHLSIYTFINFLVLCGIEISELGVTNKVKWFLCFVLGL